jgi:ABC-type Zn uptake system ZnuABC Zn-binding protein ZnuA
MRAASTAVAVVVLVLMLGGCGDSSEEKAQNKVCDARDDIGKQVNDLASLTPATVTTDAVKQDLDAIRNDVSDITDALSDLSSDRRGEVETATKEFTDSVQEIASEFGSSLSAADAKTAMVTALDKLEASYKEAFATLNCD